ncbi:MFS general substrate transporter [Hanseniaspora valbyensis NRRL Y-1626]|uniref:MFS general substrate transporter n=1 Tax=Hanseniaspora valbyensis NRRL Y-1626 TaxID=766949 RepID=A0A1B7TFD3_9ASCO|nr:MFS general substrate transporter [Hanseniaspora valbyensis NRRL Y-1626]
MDQKNCLTTSASNVSSDNLKNVGKEINENLSPVSSNGSLENGFQPEDKKIFTAGKEIKLKRSKDADETFNFFKEFDGVTPEITPEEEAKLTKKVNWCIVGLTTLTSFVFFFDKMTLSYSSILGLFEDCNLNQHRYDAQNSIFYVAYLLAQGTLFFIQRYGIKICFSIIVFLWAISIFFSVFMNSYQSVYVFRFFLGLIEGSAISINNQTMRQFLTQEEYSRFSNIYACAVLSCTIFMGFISYGVLNIKNPVISYWKILSLIIGGITTLLAVIVITVYPGNPCDCRWLSNKEKIWVIRRVQKSNHSSLDQRVLKIYQIKEACRDPITWLFGFAMFSLMLCNSLGSSQTNILYQDVGATSNLATTLISAASGGFSLACGITAYFLSYKFPTLFNSTFSIIFWTLPETISAILMIALPWDINKKVFIALISIACIYGIPFQQLICWNLQTCSGQTKLVFRQAIMMVGYALGNICSAQLYNNKQTNRYYTAWGVQLGFSFVLMPIIVVIINIILKKRNEEKLKALSDDMKMGLIEKEDGTKEAVNVALLDLTDLENDTFIYPL